jgi:hypothetical protein
MLTNSGGDNSLSTAKGLNITPTTKTFADYVGVLDANDYYSFTLSGRSSFNLGLDGLSADADVAILNSTGELIASSTQRGTTAEIINTALDSGSFYIHVYSHVGEAAYNLNLSANSAPSSLQFNTSKSSYKTGESLSLTDAWVYDGNGFSDLSQVDFWLQKDGGAWQDISDATSFTAYSGDANWGGFTYDLSGLSIGKYQLWATAYDASGAFSNSVQKEFSVVENIKPSSLQFNISKSTYTPGETVSLTDAWVYDGNGFSDLSKVDVWLQKDGGAWQDISDATSFTPYSGDANWGGFNYSLANLAIGNYQLWAVAYDSSGTYSDSVQKGFSIGDWFDQNIQDASLRVEGRSRFADGSLDRNDMIAIFTDAKDGSVVDATELTDLRTLVGNTSYIAIPDYVRVLSNKIVNGNTANAYYQGGTLGNLYAGSSGTQLENLINKWFRGSDRPTAPSGFTMTYEYNSGSLFGSDGKFSYTDIIQGYLGDCYFLAALGANAVQRPSTISNMFIDNGDGTFTVRLYGQNGGTVTTAADYVTVDRYLPTNVSDGIYSGQIFANYDNANVGLWVGLAEKAYAQFAEQGLTQSIAESNGYVPNSYGSIETGWSFRVMPSISGINGGYYSDINYTNFGNYLGSFLSLSDIASKIASGVAIVGGTIAKPSDNSPDVDPKSGIVYSHEYIILSADTTTGMLTMYNPWADTSAETGDNAGYKTISYNDFKTYFNLVQVA